MSVVKTTVFGPMLPKIDPEKLPDKFSQLARNLRLGSGALEPWRDAAPVAGVTLPGSPEVKTLHRFGRDTSSKQNYWWQFPGDVDIVAGFINTDTEETTYWTDGVYPKEAKASTAGLQAGVGITPSSLRLGLPGPGWAAGGASTWAPVATVSGTATDSTSDSFTSTYVVTYVTSSGKESAPSDASGDVNWRAGQTVTITLPGNITGPYDITRVRVYRSNTGKASTAFQFLTELSVAATTASDTDPDAELGETCQTFDFTPPPDGLVGLTDLSNGILAGFVGNTVSFCEQNYPYAWPAKYDLTMPSPVVGMAAFDQTLVVGTKTGVVLVTGIDPSAMSRDIPQWGQAAVSKRSFVNMLGGVVYAAANGLWLINASGPKNLTESVMTKDQWQAYRPESIHAYATDGCYVAFYDTGSKHGSLIFSFGDDAGVVECDVYATAAYVEPQLDSMFVVRRSGTANTLAEWDTGSPLTAVWRGAEVRFQSGVLMGRARVVAAAYPVTLRLFADGVLKYTKSVPNAFPFVLPAGRNYVVSYQIESDKKVTLAGIATSSKELGDG